MHISGSVLQMQPHQGLKFVVKERTKVKFKDEFQDIYWLHCWFSFITSVLHC
jgi:hypothetical protein